VQAPYTDIPIFVKAGSILPFGPAIQYASEKKADPIRLYIYTGQDGAFTLYEDEGINYNYEKGAYSEIPMRYNTEEQSLTIDTRKGEFAGMLKTRTFEIVWVTPDQAKALDMENTPDGIVIYEGEKLVVRQ
ncbi:MAG: DUF5110 domain-containing protein, partial [Sedimentisphaerales bacterium]|nr:DUF5110 domain-containing protein [Sedimentisphaerales bacterium]